MNDHESNVIKNDLSSSLIDKKSDPKINSDENFEKFLANKKFQLTMRFLWMLIVMAGLMIGKLWITPSEEVSCLVDPLHDLFSNLNQKVNMDNSLAQGLQISSSLLMDITFFVLFCYWVLYIKSGRLVVSLALFYGFRAINQILIKMRFPEGFYWEEPDFPSFTVPYGRTSDFFYSGHVGFLSICTYEWFMIKKYKMMAITILINIYMIIVLLTFRTHYAIDISTGLVVAHWIFFLVVKYENYLNSFFKKTIRIPYDFYVKIIQNKNINKNLAPKKKLSINGIGEEKEDLRNI